MKLIEITNDAGAVLEIPDNQVTFAVKQPLNPEYVVGLFGAVMKVNGTVTPFEQFKQRMLESDTELVSFPIPEGTDAIVNPKGIMFITAIDLTITAIMFTGGLKVIVAEGINTVRSKLTGKSPLVGV